MHRCLKLKFAPGRQPLEKVASPMITASSMHFPLFASTLASLLMLASIDSGLIVTRHSVDEDDLSIIPRSIIIISCLTGGKYCYLTEPAREIGIGLEPLLRFPKYLSDNPFGRQFSPPNIQRSSQLRCRKLPPIRSSKICLRGRAEQCVAIQASHSS